ncbi:MAG: hypothetical protein JRN20_07630 [Nitrososphaerota archaeon]|nr:hypothetical protein [Nitrososphaerota archaeon]
MKNIASKIFVAISLIGIVEAIYHAWREKAFTTNIFEIHYSGYASFFGIPYWLFGLVWFPLVFVIVLWRTRFTREPLGMELLAFLTIGNAFTAYMWYLDIIIVKVYTLVYIALYVTNYVLTALVVLQHRSNDVSHGYVYGTVTGAIIGLLFGPYGVAACGIAGGMFGAVRNFFVPKRDITSDTSKAIVRERLQEEKEVLERKLKEIEARISETEK